MQHGRTFSSTNSPLPSEGDCETFYLTVEDIEEDGWNNYTPGWYWWLSESDRSNSTGVGPFDTEVEAIADATCLLPEELAF